MVPAQANEKRTRNYSSKSRTGCITCRKRRLKCDESSPICNRCLLAGRPCEKPLNWNNGNAWVAWEPNNRKADTFHEAETIRTSLSSEVKFKSEVEDPQLIGLFIDSVGPASDGFFDVEYWARMNCYAASTYPECQHLMVARVMLSNHYQPANGAFTNGVGKNNLKRSMLCYHRGLRALQATLRTRPADPDTKMLLLICVKAIVALELIYGNYTVSLAHLVGAIKGAELAKPEVQASLDPEIFRHFKRIDLQASTYAWGRVPLLRPSGFVPQPQEFGSGSMEDFARARFDDIGLEIYAFLRKTADDVRFASTPCNVTQQEIVSAKCSMMRLETELHLWYSQFGPVIEEPRNLAAKALRLMYNQYNIVLSTCLHQDENIYDRFEQTFSAILDDAAELCHPGKLFVMDSVAIQPLYITALKCRRKSIRQRALDILASTNVQEGVWNARSLRGVATKAIEIEEQMTRDLGRDPEKEIPLEARIYEVDLAEANRDTVRMVFMGCRYKPEGPDGPWKNVEATVEYDR